MSDPEQPRLQRKLGLFSATSLVVANMIGAGIFTTSGLLMGELGSPLLMLGLWVAGGLLALSGALCYGELGAAMPEAGGEYVYLGRIYHPAAGFLSGWISFLVGFSAPLAASSLGSAEYLAAAFPGLLPAGYTVAAKKALALALIVALSVVHLRGLESGARIQNYLTAGKVLLIVVLIAAGASLGDGSITHLFDAYEPAAGRPSIKTAGLALMWIMFAYSGWNAAAYVGSEVRDPDRNLPYSLLLGTGLVMILYLGLNLLFVYAIRPEEMEGVIAIGALAAEQLLGGWAPAALSVAIGFALLSSISSLILVGPRVYYAMARDGYLFATFAEVDPSAGVPARAIALQSLFAMVLVVSGTFEQILTYMGFCLGIFPILAVLGLFKLRGRGDTARSWMSRVGAPIVYAAVSSAILVLAYLERPFESSFALLTVAAGVPAYLYFLRSRASGGVSD